MSEEHEEKGLHKWAKYYNIQLNLRVGFFMPQKKVPTRSKIIVAIVAFLATLYVLFVGISYLKFWNDFKPYHKLAVELNEGLGGGYTIKETKNCSLEGPVCPIVVLLKSQKASDDESTKQYKNSFVSAIRTSGLKNIKDDGCFEFQKGVQCTVSASDAANKLQVSYSVDKGEEYISIQKR